MHQTRSKIRQWNGGQNRLELIGVLLPQRDFFDNLVKHHPKGECKQYTRHTLHEKMVFNYIMELLNTLDIHNLQQVHMCISKLHLNAEYHQSEETAQNNSPSFGFDQSHRDDSDKEGQHPIH